jgi:hypothetical protein
MNNSNILTIKEAALGASDYLKKNVTTKQSYIQGIVNVFNNCKPYLVDDYFFTTFQNKE